MPDPFSSDGLMPHGQCYLWRPALVWLHAGSDTIIGLSYLAISTTLFVFVRQCRGEIPFRWLFVAFAVFIVACGGTHLMDVWTLWTPTYWLAGDLKVVTAVASAATAVALPPLLPQVLTLVRQAKASEERGQRLSERTAELQSLNLELEEFTYSVSHDLRAPLRHINGFARLLLQREDGRLDPTSTHYLENVARGAESMSELIDALLAFARASRAELHTRRIDLGSVAREVVEELTADLAGRSIAWQVEELPAVEGDRTLLRIVCVNLLSNAIKFTSLRSEARIHVGATAGGEEATVFVRDNGVGFDPRHAPKLFGVFQRLHSEDQFDGHGIGLATVRRIVHRHGGRVWAVGQVHEGATFYFSLRLARAG
jgi:signal transduction histidine kinase